MKAKKSSRSTSANRAVNRSRAKKNALPKNASPLKRVHHHAKRLVRKTPMFVHGAVAGAFIGVIVVMGLGATLPAHALAVTSVRDCDTNAVINCGALTTAELQQRYNNNGVAAIYLYFGISAQDIAATGTTAVSGRVYKNGTVVVDGKVVATDAITAGRENIAGSTKVTSGGVTFYKRPPQVSFSVDSIAAFVVLQDGQFKYAILAACGNPVIATALAKPTPPPAPPPEAPPTPKTLPPPVTSTQTPPSTPTVTLASQPVAPSLPNTGPGSILIIGLLAVIGGYLFHTTHHHIKRRRQIRHSA